MNELYGSLTEEMSKGVYRVIAPSTMPTHRFHECAVLISNSIVYGFATDSYSPVACQELTQLAHTIGLKEYRILHTLPLCHLMGGLRNVN